MLSSSVGIVQCVFRQYKKKEGEKARTRPRLPTLSAQGRVYKLFNGDVAAGPLCLLDAPVCLPVPLELRSLLQERGHVTEGLRAKRFLSADLIFIKSSKNLCRLIFTDILIPHVTLRINK